MRPLFLAAVCLLPLRAVAAPDAQFDGSRPNAGSSTPVFAQGRGSRLAATVASPKQERPAPPPLGADIEKKTEKSSYDLNQDVKAGLVGGIIGMVLACTLAPYTAPLLAPALIGFAIGALLFGGGSRLQQYLAKNKKD